MDRRRRWLRLAPLAGLALVSVLALAAGLTVSQLEERDSFCISCHTAPEQTYYDRARAALTVSGPFADLSSAHYGMETTFRCIDCHRGNGELVHRIATLGLGARDTAIWLSGQADESIEKTELVAPGLLTSACTGCHTEALLEVGFNNHFHNKLPEAYALWSGGQPLQRPPDAPDLPEAYVFETGTNRWRKFDRWPPDSASATPRVTEPRHEVDCGRTASAASAASGGCIAGESRGPPGARQA